MSSDKSCSNEHHGNFSPSLQFAGEAVDALSASLGDPPQGARGCHKILLPHNQRRWEQKEPSVIARFPFQTIQFRSTFQRRLIMRLRRQRCLKLKTNAAEITKNPRRHSRLLSDLVQKLYNQACHSNGSNWYYSDD